MDDAAVLATSGEQLILTSDALVEGVHYLSDDPPETVGWKLAAVNLSDLAAKGADATGMPAELYAVRRRGLGCGVSRRAGPRTGLLRRCR